ncbi:Vasopressin V1b receptor [Lemmus lemmus]
MPTGKPLKFTTDSSLLRDSVDFLSLDLTSKCQSVATLPQKLSDLQVMLGCQGRKHSRMHLFVLHLALTDLGVALFQVLPQLLWDITYRFQGSDILCRAVKYLQVLSMFASTYMLLAMTLDRARGCWTAGQISIFLGGHGPTIIWTTMAIFVLPVAMLTACYSLICCEIYKNLKAKTQAGREERKGRRTWAASSSSAPAAATRRLPSQVSSISTISRAKLRTVKMTFVIVLAFIACWAPFFSVQMWSVWDEEAPNEGKCAAYVSWLGLVSLLLLLSLLPLLLLPPLLLLLLLLWLLLSTAIPCD